MSDNHSRIQQGCLRVGDRFPTLRLVPIDGDAISIPDANGALTHIQFRRFAGCPVCNLHLRSVSARIDEINAAGIHEVVIFHSTVDELRKYQDDMPFPVVADPDKKLYRRFGVEASPKAVLNPGAWRSLPRGWWYSMSTAIKNHRAPLPASPTNGGLGLPADVLVDKAGLVRDVKYGRHAYDQWAVDELLTLGEPLNKAAS